jgi:hypothetical protein
MLQTPDVAYEGQRPRRLLANDAAKDRASNELPLRDLWVRNDRASRKSSRGEEHRDGGSHHSRVPRGPTL